MMSNSVSLKEFIKETLVAIVGAVKEAQSENDEIGKFIASRLTANMKISDNSLLSKGNRDLFSTVEFDVAVTADKTTTAGGSGSIKVLSVKVGAEGEKQLQDTTVSHVKFAIPILIPMIKWPGQELIGDVSPP